MDRSSYSKCTEIFHVRYAEALAALKRSASSDYACVEAPDSPWLYFRNSHYPINGVYGWKAHLSGSILKAPDLINALAENFDAIGQHHFKIAMPQTLLKLNQGLLGRTQIGKLITLYSTEMCDLTEMLHKVATFWKDENCPIVPSDVQMKGNSSVSVRYGSLTAVNPSFDEWGLPQWVIETECGKIKDDRSRTPVDQGLQNIPISHELETSVLHDAKQLTLDGLSLCVLSIMSNTPKGLTVLAIDDAARPCVIKTAQRGVLGDVLGNDARTRLRNEANILRLIGQNGYHPVLYKFYDGTRESILVRSDVDGVPLTSRWELFFRTVEKLAKVGDVLHTSGFVHRDLKPDNVIFDGRDIHLIDFELSAKINSVSIIPGGTCNYYPEGNPVCANKSVDFWGFAGIYASSLLGYDIARLKHSGELVTTMLQSEGFFKQARIYSYLISGNYNSLSDAAKDILQAGVNRDENSTLTPHFSIIYDVAQNAGNQIAASAKLSEAGGTYWRNEHLFASVIVPSVNGGVAGAIFGLWLLGRLLKSHSFDNYIAEGARWLMVRKYDTECGGLFTGEAGVALALGLAAHATGDGMYLAECRRRLENAEQTNVLDLFSGQAGIALTGVILSKVLKSDEWLVFSERATGRILLGGPVLNNGFLVWPEKINFSSGRYMLGAAHGAAGIAAALSLISKDIRGGLAGRIAQDVLGCLLRGVLRSEESPFYRSTAGDQANPAQWCHGLAGLLWSSAALARTGVDVEADRALLAKRICTLPTPSHDTTMCHGMSGLYESLIQLPENAAAGNCRRKIVRQLLLMYNGELAARPWFSEDRTLSAPDVWIGCLAPAVTLARHESQLDGSILDPEIIALLA